MPIRRFSNETGNFAGRKPKETAMKFEMFDILNYDKWGILIKQWAHDSTSRPKDITEFKDQVEKAGVVATYPRDYKTLVFVDTSSTDPTLVIKLPPPDLLDQAEQDLATQDYPLPPFYPDLMRDPSLKNNTPPGRLLFHNNRVGEYTIKFCG
jgi:hypothetical protein